MSWDKIGVKVVARPVAHGAGIYLRVPKKVAKAYDLYTAADVEFTIERAKREETSKGAGA